VEIKLGHILTSHWRDKPSGLELTYYGSSNGRPFKLVFPQQKIVFFLTQTTDFNPNHIKFERKSGGLKNFTHELVDTIYLNSYKDLIQTREYCQLKGIRTYELDVLPTERFLMERFINSQVEFQGDYDSIRGVDVYQSPQLRPADYTPNLSSLSLDIETGVGGELYSIGLYFESGSEVKKMVYMLADENKIIDSELTFYNTQKQIILGFLETLHQWDPDFIIGWHVIGFDLKFLEKKCLEFKIEFKMGRQQTPIRIDDRKGVGFFADTYGRVILDGPPILRGAFYQFKNFKLDTVASEVLGVGKDIASDAGKVSEIERRFKEDKIALAKYNLLDCSLVTDIFNKLGIFNLLIERTKISGMLFDRLPVSTAAFDHVFLPKLHRKGYIAPNRVDINREDSSTGGMVIEPKSGLHKNVAIFDFKSLYPSIIKTFKIDPYSRVQAGVNTLKTPKEIEFSRTEHLLPDIISTLLNKREIAKQNQDGALSQAIKILMNSFYGIMGSSRCRFYHSDLPSAITTTGHWVLKTAISFFENRGYDVIYGDTDSIFVKMEEQDDSKITDLKNELNDFMDRIVQEEFGLTSYLECEFEKMFHSIYFSFARSGDGVAKKRYAGIYNGKVEFKGMEFVRSDWTDLAKDFQLELYQMFFAGEELEFYIKDFIKKLEDGQFDDKLVYTKRLSKAPSEYTKNIPVHVKAALQVNHTGPYRLKEVSYVITKNGPEPINNDPKGFDYQHYIEKQLKPIADDILISQDKSFDAFILGDQLSFF
jgi:DNA polymerase-2